MYIQDSEMPCCLASPLSVCPTPTPSVSSIPGDEHLLVYILPSAGGMIFIMIILIAVITVCYRTLGLPQFNMSDSRALAGFVELKDESQV